MQANNNRLHLRFAADGRRNSNKIGTVMVVFSILDEKQHDCEHQYPKYQWVTFSLRRNKPKKDNKLQDLTCSSEHT